MLNLLSLENFKSIKDHDFELRNLTIFSGFNGMGKSSALQSLLLLRQSHDKHLLPSVGLSLTGEYVKIGNGKDLLYSYANDENIKIEVIIGDAREYIQTLQNIDIVYQDAFSSEVNCELWTYEYFKDIFTLCNENAIITTYSVATPIRLSMYKAGFEIYQIKPVKKKQTIAFKTLQNIDAKYIDMELKQQRNKEAKPLYDK